MKNCSYPISLYVRLQLCEVKSNPNLPYRALFLLPSAKYPFVSKCQLQINNLPSYTGLHSCPCLTSLIIHHHIIPTHPPSIKSHLMINHITSHNPIVHILQSETNICILFRYRKPIIASSRRISVLQYHPSILPTFHSSAHLFSRIAPCSKPMPKPK